jgi:hypothetical protein
MRLSTATLAQHETRPEPSKDNDRKGDRPAATYWPGIFQADEHRRRPNQRPWPHERRSETRRSPTTDQPREARDIARRPAAADDERSKAFTEI